MSADDVFDSSRYERPWKLPGATPPARVQTSRLLLRCWEPGDAPRLAPVLAASRDHLVAWIPPAAHEPTDLEGVERRLERFRTEFEAGEGFVYGIFDRRGEEVLGGAALMPRIGPGALEIGYWVRVDRVGRGVASEATLALTEAGLAVPGVERIEIRVAEENGPSVAVPRKLGYRLVGADEGAAEPEPGRSGRLLVFEATSDLLAGRSGFWSRGS